MVANDHIQRREALGLGWTQERGFRGREFYFFTQMVVSREFPLE